MIGYPNRKQSMFAIINTTNKKLPKVVQFENSQGKTQRNRMNIDSTEKCLHQHNTEHIQNSKIPDTNNKARNGRLVITINEHTRIYSRCTKQEYCKLKVEKKPY